MPALAVCLATANTLVMYKTPKMTVHMCAIIPCQNSCHPKRLSGVFKFFLIFQNFFPINLSLAKQQDTIRTVTELRLLSSSSL